MLFNSESLHLCDDRQRGKRSHQATVTASRIRASGPDTRLYGVTGRVTLGHCVFASLC